MAIDLDENAWVSYDQGTPYNIAVSKTRMIELIVHIRLSIVLILMIVVMVFTCVDIHGQSLIRSGVESHLAH